MEQKLLLAKVGRVLFLVCLSIFFFMIIDYSIVRYWTFFNFEHNSMLNELGFGSMKLVKKVSAMKNSALICLLKRRVMNY